MVQVLKTDNDLQENNFQASERESQSAFTDKKPQSPVKQTRRKRVRKTIEENYIDEEPIVTNSGPSPRHDDAADEFEDGDDEIDAALNAFQDPFSGFGDGPLMLKVYRLPPTNPRGHSRGGMQFVESYTFDPEMYETQLRDNFPEGGDFYLVLCKPSGAWLTKKPFPLAPKPGFQGTLRQNPEKSNLSQPDANTGHQEPDRFARFGEQFLEKALSKLLDAPAPAAPPPDEFSQMAKQYFMKKIESMDDRPPLTNPEKPRTWADAFVEVGIAFADNSPGALQSVVDLAKIVVPSLLKINQQAAPVQNPAPHYDATAPVVSETLETGAIEAEATVVPNEPPPANKPTWEQAAQQTLSIAVDAILNSKPIATTAAYVNGLAIDYPDAPVNYKVILPLATAEDVHAMLIAATEGDTQHKLKNTPEAINWIKQLQAELKK